MDHEISVDSDVFALLQREALAFVDTPNTVLRRLLGLEGTRPRTPHLDTQVERQPRRQRGKAAKGRQSEPVKRSRAPKGVLLPESDYEIPLLATIADLGGKVPASEALAALEPKIKARLQPMDLELLEGSGLVRWKNRAQFCRLKLVQRGDLVAGSPRGVWEISEQGRHRVEDGK